MHAEQFRSLESSEIQEGPPKRWKYLWHSEFSKPFWESTKILHVYIPFRCSLNKSGKKWRQYQDWERTRNRYRSGSCSVQALHNIYSLSLLQQEEIKVIYSIVNNVSILYSTVKEVRIIYSMGGLYSEDYLVLELLYFVHMSSELQRTIIRYNI